jgi:hypothetical protein
MTGRPASFFMPAAGDSRDVLFAGQLLKVVNKLIDFEDSTGT